MQSPARFFTVAVLVVVGGCAQLGERSTVNLDDVDKDPHFVMANNLMGIVVKSSDSADVGKKITFVSLDSAAPKVVFESGMTSPVQKVHEDDASLTLLLVAPMSGSVDAFVIDKKTGRFARAAAGSFTGVHALASVGTFARMK